MPLRWITLMAWRNAWRRPRRSVLALITITAGLCVLIFLRGVQDGYVAQRVEAVVSLGAGHAIVIPEAGGTSPFLEETESILARLEKVPGLAGRSPRIRFEGYLQGKSGAGGAEILAFIAEDEARVTALPARLENRRGFDSPGADDLPPIALGAGLAARLSARAGDTVTLLAKTPAGPPAADRYRVGTLLRTGVAALDAHMALMRLDDARTLLGTGSIASEIAVRMKEAAALPDLVRFWEENGGAGTRISTWEDQAPEVRQTLDMLKLAEKLRGIVVFGLVGLGIANMLTLSVLERRHEFGVLVAAGVAPRWLLLSVLLESLAIGAVGVVAGCALGAAITGGLFGRTGIDLGMFGTRLGEVFGIAPVLYPVVTPSNLATASAWVFLVSALVALPAAWRVIQTDPADAVREA